MTASHEYVKWVLHKSNERETGRLVKLAAQRFLSDLKRKDIYFDESEAVKMPQYCENFLFQWEGDWEGVAFKLELWQQFIFEQVFGWIRTDTDTRRFTEVYVQIAKKNGKSSMSAGLMNYHITGDERVKTPKVFTAANNEEQAKICVNMAGKIIEASPVLAGMVDKKLIKLMHYGENIIGVVNMENNGFIKTFSKESADKNLKTTGGKHGVNASLGVVDEFGMSPDHGASKTIKTSMASRRERLMFYITTAGYNLNGPCFTELRKVGIQVLEGIVTKDNYLPIIHEIDQPEDLKITPEWLLANEWCWRQSNPNIDISVNRESLREMLADAVTYGGTTEVDVMTLNFNRWMQSADSFIPEDVWNKNYHGDQTDVEGEECFVGVEIAPSGAASAICFLFPGEITRIKMLYFLAEESLRKNEFYQKNKDYFKVDAGNEVENDTAVKWILEEFEKYQVNSFCFPNTQKNNSIIQALINNGYTGNPIAQGVQSIANPTEEWEKLLKAGKIEHFNDPILRWMNSNCLAVRKEAGTRIEKNSNVLGIYACINAVAEWKTSEANEVKVSTEFYEL